LGTSVTGATVSQLGSGQVYTYPWGNNITSGNLTSGVGYRALINGNTTITTSGTLTTGDVTATINTGAKAFSFVSNPYQAVLDFKSLTSSNLQAGYWYLDPTATTTDGLGNVYEGYDYWSSPTGPANTYTSGGLTLDKYIQPGQGFFVQNQDNSSASSLTFKEAALTYTQTPTSVFGTATPLNRIATGLFKAGKNVDGAVTVFNTNFSTGFDQYDGVKFSNHFENLTFKVGSNELCANATNLPSAGEELALHLYNLSVNTAYTLKLNASQFSASGLSAYLKDSKLGTQTLLTDSISVNFTADSANLSSRFSILFGASTLPVKSISLSAAAINSKQVSIKWSSVGQLNVVSYKVERSLDGVNFSALATVSPASSSNYSFVDDNATATAYYRIKATDNIGLVSYSNVISITNYESGITVYPNPISGNSFKIGIGAIGKYNVSLVNKLGQSVYSTTINHTAASNLETVTLNSKLATGSYILKATEVNGSVKTSEIIIK
jgi:hypothetical protein